MSEMSCKYANKVDQTSETQTWAIFQKEQKMQKARTYFSWAKWKRPKWKRTDLQKEKKRKKASREKEKKKEEAVTVAWELLSTE